METAGVWEDPLDHPETIIPIQKADADFLFVIGGQDKNLHTKHYADLAIKFLKDAGKSNYEVILFKGCKRKLIGYNTILNYLFFIHQRISKFKYYIVTTPSSVICKVNPLFFYHFTLFRSSPALSYFHTRFILFSVFFH